MALEPERWQRESKGPSQNASQGTGRAGDLAPAGGKQGQRRPTERAYPSARGGFRRGGKANLPQRAAANRCQTGLKGGGPLRLRWFMRPILRSCEIVSPPAVERDRVRNVHRLVGTGDCNRWKIGLCNRNLGPRGAPPPEPRSGRAPRASDYSSPRDTAEAGEPRLQWTCLERPISLRSDWQSD